MNLNHSRIHRNGKSSHVYIPEKTRSKLLQDAQRLSQTITEILFSKGKKRVNFEAIIELGAMRSLDDNAILTRPTSKKGERKRVEYTKLRNKFK